MAQENRTEKATPYRRKKLREEGNVAKSTELTSSITVFLSTIAILFLGLHLISEVLSLFSSVSVNPIAHPLFIISYIGNNFPTLLVPFFLLTFLSVIIVYVGQFGFIFTLKPLQFKWERLNPIEGVKRIFSLTTAFELAKNTLKILTFLIISYFLLKGELIYFIKSPSLDSYEFLVYFLRLLFKVVIVLSIFAILIALLDFGFKKWDYERRIRMSKEEVKEEYKQHEGNPLVKSALRKRMRQLSRGRMMKEVPKASVVITNPTHIAIALRYSPEEGDKAPRVLAKGKGEIAERIVQIAKDYGVPIIRKEELARAMYPVLEVGEEIPPKFYRAVAEIIAFIMFRKKRVSA